MLERGYLLFLANKNFSLPGKWTEMKNQNIQVLTEIFMTNATMGRFS